MIPFEELCTALERHRRRLAGEPPLAEPMAAAPLHPKPTPLSSLATQLPPPNEDPDESTNLFDASELLAAMRPPAPTVSNEEEILDDLAVIESEDEAPAESKRVPTEEFDLSDMDDSVN